MIKRRIILILLSALLFALPVGCSTLNHQVNTYKQITPEKAKALMDQETDCVILDVRTEEEFTMGHVENAILIPDYEIEAKAETVLTDKKQLILVYCRSGRRSKIAAEKLVNMGYTNVKEFGGIIDWKYEIVTE